MLARFGFAIACIVNTDRSQVYIIIAITSILFGLVFMANMAGLLAGGNVLASPVVPKAIIVRNFVLALAVLADMYAWYVIFRKK